jgi:hypothetical protein
MQTKRERERERNTHTVEKLAKFRSSSPSRFCGFASQENTRRKSLSEAGIFSDSQRMNFSEV